MHINTVKVSERYIWLGTLSGLVRLDRPVQLSKLRCYTTQDGLPNNNVRTIALDPDTVWIGTPAGLAQYQMEEDRWIVHTNTEDRLHHNITSISIKDDQVWVGTTAGVSCFDRKTKRWTRHTSAASTEVLRSDRLGRLAGDGDYIWFSNWNDSTEGAIGQFDRRTETFRFFGKHDLPLKQTEKPITHLRWITVDEDCVWFGTNGGLLRYERITDTWRHYTIADGLANNDVWNIVSDGEYIWTSHIGGVVSRYSSEKREWETYEICPSVLWSNIGSIDADARYVWFTTTWDGVRRYDKSTDTWASFAESDGLGVNETNQVLIDGDYVWVSAWGDVSRFDMREEEWEIFSSSRVLSGVTTWLDKGIDGVWLMYTWGDNIAAKYHNKTDSWTTLKMPRMHRDPYGSSEEGPTQTVETPDNVWFATKGRGLVRYNKASKDWSVFNEENGLASNRISERSLLMDDDYVWVGTDKGLCRYDKRRESWTTFTQSVSAQAIRTKKVYAIAVEQRYVWMGASDGLHRYDKQTDRWIRHRRPSITCIAVDKKFIWLGTNDGIRRYDKITDGWQDYKNEHGLPSNSIRDLDIKGYDLWVATDSGVGKFNRLSDDPNAWETYTCTLDVRATQDEEKYAHALPSNDVRCVAIGEKAVWFGTDKGACRYDKAEHTWVTFTSEDGLFGTDIGAIVIDGEDVWFGTDMGTTKYNSRSHDFISYGTTEGLASDVVTCIALNDEAIWFGSPDAGVTRLDKATGKWRIFTTEDGLLHNRVVAIALDGDHIWFSTEGGVCRYDKTTGTWTGYADE